MPNDNIDRAMDRAVTDFRARVQRLWLDVWSGRVSKDVAARSLSLTPDEFENLATTGSTRGRRQYEENDDGA